MAASRGGPSALPRTRPHARARRSAVSHARCPLATAAATSPTPLPEITFHAIGERAERPRRQELTEEMRVYRSSGPPSAAPRAAVGRLGEILGGGRVVRRRPPRIAEGYADLGRARAGAAPRRARARARTRSRP